MTCGYSPVRTGIAARFTCRKRPETPGTANTPLFGGKEGWGGVGGAMPLCNIAKLVHKSKKPSVSKNCMNAGAQVNT